jgi:hypothetical protein
MAVGHGFRTLLFEDRNYGPGLRPLLFRLLARQAVECVRHTIKLLRDAEPDFLRPFNLTWCASQRF